MKIHISQSAKARGSVLLVSLLTTFIIGLTLASYLLLVQAESTSVARSQRWNDIMVVTEAGVEDSLQLINKYAGTPNLSQWTATAGADGWTQIGNVFYVRRYLEPAKNIFYDVYVTNFVSGPVIYCVGYVPAPNLYAQATPQSFFASAGVALYADSTVTRKVNVATAKDPLFSVAMAAKGSIDMKGNNVGTDSFDSQDPTYSTNGRYDSTKRKGGGDVVTNDAITNSVLSVGNANIMGHVKTGPTGNITIGPNGSVGDVSWVSGNNKGIEKGWADNDMNVQFEDVILPGSMWLPSLGGATVNGTYYDYVFLSSGNYSIPSSGSIYVGSNAVVTVNVTAGSFSPNSIYVAGDAATSGKLTIYMSGASMSLNGNDVVQSGDAANLIFYGLPTCTSISFSGNAAFTGAIYAPEADFSLGGGGNNTIDFIGSSVTKTVTLNGHFNFHYDENLKRVGPARGYIPSSWTEVF